MHLIKNDEKHMFVSYVNDVYINEDLSQRVMARRRELMPRLREAREQGKIAYLTYDKLVVRDRVERA